MGKQHKKPGRSNESHGKKKNRRVVFYCTPEEFDLLKERAALEGLSCSAYIRSCVNGKKVRSPHEKVVQQIFDLIILSNCMESYVEYLLMLYPEANVELLEMRKKVRSFRAGLTNLLTTYRTRG